MSTSIRTLTLRTLAAWALVFFAGGCAQFRWDFWNTPAKDSLANSELTRVPIEDNPLARRRLADEARPVVVQLMFDVSRAIVPADKMVAVRKELWRHADALRLSPARAADLARNGFHIGVADARGREAVRKVLDSVGARFERKRHIVQNGVPLTLDLGGMTSGEDVFYLPANAGPVGTTFTGATRLLHVDYEVSLGARAVTTLILTWELFKESEGQSWNIQDGQPRYQKKYEGKVYNEMAATFDVPTGEAILVGPIDGIRRSWTLGGTMLTDTLTGEKWETILCIEPVLVRFATE